MSNNDNEKQVMDENEWDNNLKETDSWLKLFSPN